MKRLFALVLFLCAVSVPAAAATVNVKSLDMGKNVQVWYVEDHTLPMIAMTAALPAGSAYDPKEKPGVADFTADLLNEGAGNLNSQQFQAALSNKAIRLTMTPTRDYLVISIVTLSENAKEAFRLLGLALTKPRFDNDAIARVRAQLIASLQQQDEDPQDVASKGFMSTFMGSHPYAHPIDGTIPSISRISRNDIKAFARAHWLRNGLKISVSGDADPEALKVLIGSAFGQLPAKWAPPVAPVTHMGVPGVHVIPLNVPQPTAIFGLPGILRSDRDFIPAYVANYILGGGGFSSRLMQEVREKRGLTYGISSSLDTLRKAGIFAVQVATRANAMQQTIDVVRSTMKDFADNGATDKELADAKTYITGSFPLAFSSNTGIANQLNSFQRVGLPIDYIVKRNALINAVTLDDVKRVAKRLFNANKMTIVVGGTMRAGPARTKPLPGGGKPPTPAQPPAKPSPPKTTAPAPKPPVASTTAAKPKEQRRGTPAAAAPATTPHP
ncbi:MAG TPA: insulinase family protein [Rhizomicrobium sp.]|jgi:zinc protease|nr:insulinase family protein [Rhizomicrobium sp.]